MKKMKLISILAGLALGSIASAGVMFTFDVDSITLAPGQTVAVKATVTNNSNLAAIIDGASISVSDAFAINLDDFDFLMGSPATMAPSESYYGNILVTADAAAATGWYSAEYSLLGHFEDFSSFEPMDTLRIQVNPVPEPATMVGLSVAIGFLARRKRK